MSDPDLVAPDGGEPAPAETLLAEIVNGFRTQRRAGDAAFAKHLRCPAWRTLAIPRRRPPFA